MSSSAVDFALEDNLRGRKFKIQSYFYISASPQIASSSAGDCAFEDDVCGWTNPGRNDGLDELNWERLEARGEPRYPQVNLIY